MIVAPHMWELVPPSVRKCKTLNEFKTKIKSCYPDHYPHRLYKNLYSTIRFHLKRMYTSFYGRTRLHILVTIIYLQYDVMMLP